LRSELEAVDDPRREGLCTYCNGTGVDDDPGMTRFYSEKYLRSSWTAPEQPQERSFAAEAAQRTEGIRLLSLVEDAWAVIARQFACEMLAIMLESEVTEPHVDICPCCNGSGLANDVDYSSGWALRQGWQPPTA
jgi:hypothetical protein